MATYGALDIAANISSNIIYYSLEQARAGNLAFAQYFFKTLPVAYRVTHYKDIVVHLPPETLSDYKHIATEVYYNENFSKHTVCDQSGEDPSCADQWPLPFSAYDHTHLFNTTTGCPKSTYEEFKTLYLPNVM